MAKTFNASYSNLTLSNASYNPVYVTGTITGTASALEGAAPTRWTIDNSGRITGGASASTAGIRLDAGGLVINQAGGTISGYNGIAIYGAAGTIVDTGSIAGTKDAVRLAVGYANTLAIAPGAVIVGTVDGGNTIGATAASTLSLAAGNGTLSGLGTDIVHFADIVASPGANWTLAADALGGSYTVYDGTLLTNQGSLGSTVTLAAGASLTNALGAMIATKAAHAVYAPGGGIVTNAGLLSGASGAVLFGAGAAGVLTIDPGAVFTGKVDGGNTLGAAAISTLELASNVSAGTLSGFGTQIINFATILVDSGATWTLTSAALGAGYVIYDSGTLTNRSHLGSVVSLSPGAVLTNAMSALFTAASGPAAVYGTFSSNFPYGYNHAVTVTNAGTIRDSGGDGIELRGGGYVTNLSGGIINGLYAGFGVYNYSGTITNTGLITATSISGEGVFLQKGGLVINEPGGTISDAFASNYGAVDVHGASTVMNAGTISGVTTAVEFYSGFANRLIVEPRAVFNGLVTGGNPIGSNPASYLELASAASAGTLAGLGVQFINFGQIAVDQGASWALTSATVVSGQTVTALANSTLSDSGALYNYGVVALSSTLNVGSLLDSGVAILATGSTLDLQSTLASLGTITFAGNAELKLGTPTLVAGRIQGFAIGDTIDLADVDPASVSFASGQLYFGNGSSILLNLASGGAPFATSDNSGGALVTLCFREGTRIATTKGEIAVEHLAIGDRVDVVRGHLPITWIGHRHIHCTRHPRPRLVWPVRVMRGAFGDGLPHRDLWLSPDHAVYLNGVLIPVKYLINGETISQAPVADVIYWHVELSRHDVLCAEGLPVESYLDTGGRANFDNGGTALRLHPDFASRTWEADGCAPLLVSGPQLDAARAMLKRIALHRHSAA